MGNRNEFERAVRRILGTKKGARLIAAVDLVVDRAPILPAKGQTVAVALTKQKTAALCYDRIWSGVRDDVPVDARLHGDTAIERERLALDVIRGLQKRDLLRPSEATRLEEALVSHQRHLPEPSSSLVTRTARGVADALEREHGISAATIHDSTAERDLEYRQGDRRVIVAAIANLNVVDDDALSWEQVSEFRGDPESRLRMRRLTHWLDANFTGKSAAFIEDEIAVRLDDYEFALRKHGIATILGSLSSTLDSRFLLGGSAAISAAAYIRDPATALFVGGAIVIGKIAVSVAQALLDLRSKQREAAEVAFVAEAAKLTS